MAQTKRPFHETVAEKLIEQLKAGTAPWQKPWVPGEANAFLPMNPTTGKRYKGINAMYLMAQGHSDSRWMTYKQAAAAGAQVRKGEKGTPVQYWKFSDEQDKRDDNGQPVLDGEGKPIKETVMLERPRVFFATVFNAEQIDGLPPRQRSVEAWDAIARAETILDSSGANIQHDGNNRAFYRPTTDTIHLPDKGQFPSAAGYYATALHELGHWSGHASRLDRDLSHPFGSAGYAKEELRAEIASLILGDELGIGHDPQQHAAYVGSWIAALENDPLEIFRASADAEKIHDYVLGLSQQHVQQNSSQQEADMPLPHLDTATEQAQLTPAQARDLVTAASVHQRTVGSYDWPGGKSVRLRTGKALEALGLVENRRSDVNAYDHWIPTPRGLEVAGRMAYQGELARLLALSTLTPGRYTPSDALKSANHAAVFVGEVPAILCGPSDDPVSVAHADALAASTHVRGLFASAGRAGAIHSGVVAGSHITWQGTESAIVSKPSGQVEQGGDEGPLVAVVLDDPNDALTTSLCVTTETARIFDADAPQLDDGRNLPALARGDATADQDSASVIVAAIQQAQQNTRTWADASLGRAASIEADRAMALVREGAYDEALTYLQAAAPLERRHTTDASPFFDQAAAVLDAQWRAWRLANGLGPSITPAKKRGFEAIPHDLSQLASPAPNRSAEATEAWTLGHIEQGTLSRALDDASLEQIDRVMDVMERMQPLNTENDFWGRHALPQDVDAIEARVWALTDYLIEQRRPDAVAAAAFLDLKTGNTHSRERDREAFAQAADNAIGFTLPFDWTGHIQVQGNVHEYIDGVPHVTAADSLAVQPQFWSVYAQRQDGTHQWLVDLGTQALAEALSERLLLIDANSQVNDHDKAVKLARIREEHVRRDPNSTSEDIAAAKAVRKDAEMAAILQDEGMQRRIAEHEQQLAAGGQAGRQAQPAGNPTTEITWLDVPFTEKETAKQTVGKLADGKYAIEWDKQARRWFARPGADLDKLTQWLPGHERQEATQAASTVHLATEKTWLVVPYEQRETAKAIAGRLPNGRKAIDWDKAERCWYANPGANLDALAPWLQTNAVPHQHPAMSPREEFAEALKSMDCIVTGDHPIMDGQRHTIRAVGDKPGEAAGRYKAHLDDRPAGYIKNWRTGEAMKWKAKGYIFDPQEKAAKHAEAATKLAAREAEQDRLHEATAQRIARQVTGLVPIDAPTAYLRAKGIQPHAGALTDKEGQQTYIPAVDAIGKQWTMQYIREDGTKRFAKNSRKEGCFHAVGGIEAVAAAPTLVIAEGYATAATLAETLGHGTVTAFDSGNVPAVAKALHERFPDKPVIIAGDDDRPLELTHGTNPGRAKAQEAAQAVGGKAIFPVFAPGEAVYPAGLEPVTPQTYRAHERATTALEDAQKESAGVLLTEQQIAELKRAQLSDKQLDALTQMKRHTDFNDLANNSVLGRDGVARQVKAAVASVLLANPPRHERMQNPERGEEPEREQRHRQRRAARIG